MQMIQQCMGVPIDLYEQSTPFDLFSELAITAPWDNNDLYHSVHQKLN